MAQEPIIIVEDEKKIADLLRDYLVGAGFKVTVLDRGGEVVGLVRKNPPALILLDIMLPDLNGTDICREIRKISNVPIIMLTARVDEVDRLIGLELGADDYICKPFSPREVVARIKAILRRTQRDRVASDARLAIDEAAFRVTWDGNALDLTPVEFRLLRTLAREPGRVMSRQQLLDGLYEDHRVVTDRTVDSHVKNLRRKLADASPGEDVIRSVYGVGYTLDL